MPKLFRFLVQLLLCYRFLISINILFFVFFWAFWEIPIRVRLLMFVRKRIDHFNQTNNWNTKYQKNDTPKQPTQSPHTHIENRTSPKTGNPLSLYILLTILTIKIYIYISTKSLEYPQTKHTHLTPVYVKHVENF